MNAIVAADKNWAIGYKNKLLVSIPADMKFFRQMTSGKVVVMGRKTLESFPNGLPLKNRTNIVLTGNPNYQVKNWAIGYKNKLLVSIPADMKFFRQMTSGKVVVMGRKTLESCPNGLPLKNRTNSVLTGNPTYHVKDAVIVHTPEELLEELIQYDEEEIFVIGGESIYRMLLPYCQKVYVTKIDHA